MKKYFLPVILFMFFSLELFAQKKLRDSIVLLNLQMDSMKTLLADARREVKKSKDLLNTLTDLVEQQDISTNTKINNLKKENQLLISLNISLKDSLENAVKSATSLQRIVSDEAMIKNVQIKRAVAFAEKLRDSLVEIPKNQCYIYSRDKIIYVVLSDTLIYGAGFYLTNQGKQTLEKLLKLIKNQSSSFVSINTFASHTAKKQEIWTQANAKARTILSFFETQDFPYDRYNALTASVCESFLHYRVPPLIFEIQLN